MKKIVVMLLCVVLVVGIVGCPEPSTSQEKKDSKVVGKQQAHFATVHALPFYDYSIPRGYHDSNLQCCNTGSSKYLYGC